MTRLSEEGAVVEAVEEPMTFELRFDQDAGVVIATCSGALGLADAREGAMAFWGNAGWAGKAVVWDFRTARFDINSEEVRDLARFILDRQPALPPPRVAFVTGREVDFGMARMFEVYREHPATVFRAFQDYAEAVSWARSQMA